MQQIHLWHQRKTLCAESGSESGREREGLHRRPRKPAPCMMISSLHREGRNCKCIGHLHFSYARIYVSMYALMYCEIHIPHTVLSRDGCSSRNRNKDFSRSVNLRMWHPWLSVSRCGFSFIHLGMVGERRRGWCDGIVMMGHAGDTAWGVAARLNATGCTKGVIAIMADAKNRHLCLLTWIKMGGKVPGFDQREMQDYSLQFPTTLQEC